MTTRTQEPTPAQKQAAQERRQRIRAIAKTVAAMSPQERQALALRGVHTIEGHPLSIFNTCLTISQDPTVSVVGGFQQWRRAGRQVRKGAHGVAIWIPSHPKAEAEEDAADELRFLLGTVFDISQTDEA